MSLSRSPSPRPNGGWSTPGLDYSNSSSPGRKPNAGLNGDLREDRWASAKARSEQLRNQPSYLTRNEGFFSRSKRKISKTLPFFDTQDAKKKDWRNAEKLGRGRWPSTFSSLRTLVGNVLRRFKVAIIILTIVLLVFFVSAKTGLRSRYRRAASFGGGSKYVIIIAANQGGGVMEWKGAREWAIERDSVKNKRQYAARWGYDVDVVDMSTKKRYAHEWRESWEKVDTIRNGLRKYPDAEWFWWLDLNTFVMEPSMSLQSLIFNKLQDHPSIYRDINHYNPLNITHPPGGSDPTLNFYLDPASLSPTGDNSSSSINMIIPQDCGGFNLGSFFVRRSVFLERLLDIWWDPVLYEQKHMEWEHKEQDALEYVYRNQPWVREHIAFAEQRLINSFPPDACKITDKEGEEAMDPKIHYRERDRDFLVNMAGCEWGRDCWMEMYNYRELSKKLNRSAWQKLKDGFAGFWSRTKDKFNGYSIKEDVEISQTPKFKD